MVVVWIYHLTTKGAYRNKGLGINGLIAFFYPYFVPDGTFSFYQHIVPDGTFYLVPFAFRL